MYKDVTHPLKACVTLVSFQQKRRNQAQQLLAQARKALDEAVRLCLKHKLPTSILADASFNLLGCYGQSDHGLAGQHLALYQVLCGRLFVELCKACVLNLYHVQSSNAKHWLAGHPHAYHK